MEKLTLTFYLSIIGAITGISGLLLNFFDYWKTRPRLKAEIIHEKTFFFDKSDEIKPNLSKSYRTNRAAVISIEIQNASVHPVTLSKITVSQNSETFSIRNAFSSNMKYNIIQKGDTITSYSEIIFDDPITIPIRLEAYDSTSGTLRLAFLENAVLDSNNNIPVVVSLFTPRKTFKIEVSLSKTHLK